MSHKTTDPPTLREPIMYLTAAVLLLVVVVAFLVISRPTPAPAQPATTPISVGMLNWEQCVLMHGEWDYVFEVCRAASPTP